MWARDFIFCQTDSSASSQQRYCHQHTRNWDQGTILRILWVWATHRATRETQRQMHIYTKGTYLPKWERYSLTQIWWQRHFSSNTMKNSSNQVLRKEKSNFLAAKPKDTEYCNLTDKELKIAVIKTFSELQENSKWQYNDLKNKIRTILPKRLKF